MGTQKNRLNETVKHMLKLMGKEILTILHSKFCLSKPVNIEDKFMKWCSLL